MKRVSMALFLNCYMLMTRSGDNAFSSGSGGFVSLSCNIFMIFKLCNNDTDSG